jgi:prepilin-type N-terminal cleavage/methylation domain-containing protein
MGEKTERGYTLVELMIGMVLLGLLAISMLTLFTTLIRSTVIIKRKAVASTLAITKMEYLKSLPFNSLAMVGGSFVAGSYLPVNTTTVLNGVTYTTKTDIDYVDDAYDGCAHYQTVAIAKKYCRNYPMTGTPATDNNPQDYKIIHVKVTDQNSLILAEVDSQISGTVAETTSTNGALFITVLDANGNPIEGANVNATNTTLAPTININQTTDENGIAIFYGVPPDTGYDYVITGSLANYSTLYTIAPSGTLTPTYQSQKISSQQSSYVTLTLKPQGANSLVIETTDLNGSAISGMKVYVKGGYKKYTLSSDTSYYFDNFTPSDTRPTTDENGLAAVYNGTSTNFSLVPGPYVFCSETAGTNCKVGNNTYYVAAVLPYSGANPFNPLNVPTYLASSPPTTTFGYGGNQFLQKVRLMMTTSSSFPRVYSLIPDDVSLSTSPLSAFPFQITGANLPCSATAASCGTSVKFVQGSNTYTASCTGNATPATILSCTINLTGISAGQTQLVLKVGSNTLTIPSGVYLGGLNVSP